jgi:MFS family permease
MEAMHRRGRLWWIDRNVAGMTVTSFFGDVGYEMVNAVLPGFLASIGVAAAALGWIEGASDALSSFTKLVAGWYSDRLGRRKPIVTLGYLLSGSAMSLFAIAASWPVVLAGRLVAWFGRGIRSPLRDAMLFDSAPPEARGKVFGLHRAGDTAGAVLGPLIGVGLLATLPRPNVSAPYRAIFLVSLIPGMLAAASIVFLVRETRTAGSPRRRLWVSVRTMPRPYVRFLTGVGLFGMGDFAHTLLTLAAAQLLMPGYGALKAGEIAALLYTVHNAVSAFAAFLAGVWGDHANKRLLLAFAYFLGGATGFAVAALFFWYATGGMALIGVFTLAGVYLGFQDALEGAIPGAMVGSEVRGTAYGLMGAVNGCGDLVASALTGTLWTVVSPGTAFACAGSLMLAGAALTLFTALEG